MVKKVIRYYRQKFYITLTIFKEIINNMKANGNNIIVTFENMADLVNKGGIFIPNHAIENSKLARGKIISVGRKCKLGMEVGQFVLFDMHAINKYNDTIGALTEDNIILIEK
jgi:co-chaperonin GroES (HSP10)